MSTVYQAIATGVDTTPGSAIVISFTASRVVPKAGDTLSSAICVVAGGTATQWVDYATYFSSLIITTTTIQNGLVQGAGYNFAGAKFLLTLTQN